MNNKSILKATNQMFILEKRIIFFQQRVLSSSFREDNIFDRVAYKSKNIYFLFVYYLLKRQTRP